VATVSVVVFVVVIAGCSNKLLEIGSFTGGGTVAEGRAVVVMSGLVSVLVVRAGASFVVVWAVSRGGSFKRVDFEASVTSVVFSAMLGENKVGDTVDNVTGATFVVPTKLTCRGASGVTVDPVLTLPVPTSRRL
jgi:hypothetical protein